jgi:hypothetical protein
MNTSISKRFAKKATFLLIAIIGSFYIFLFQNCAPASFTAATNNEPQELISAIVENDGGVCGPLLNSCSVGNLEDIADTATQHQWICLGLNGGADSIECKLDKSPVAINGACGTTLNQCVTGIFKDLNDSGNISQWQCMGINQGQSSATCQKINSVSTPINGSCGVSNNSCMSGDLQDLADSSSNYIWKCNGRNGGASSPNCQQAINLSPTPINGSCGVSNNACLSGNLQDLADTSSNYVWKCLGRNAGTDSPNCQAVIPTVAVNGVCSTTSQDCISGRAYDLADSSTHFKWQCMGINGGTNSSVCQLALPATDWNARMNIEYNSPIEPIIINFKESGYVFEPDKKTYLKDTQIEASYEEIVGGAALSDPEFIVINPKKVTITECDKALIRPCKSPVTIDPAKLRWYLVAGANTTISNSNNDFVCVNTGQSGSEKRGLPACDPTAAGPGIIKLEKSGTAAGAPIRGSLSMYNSRGDAGGSFTVVAEISNETTGYTQYAGNVKAELPIMLLNKLDLRITLNTAFFGNDPSANVVTLNTYSSLVGSNGNTTFINQNCTLAKLSSSGAVVWSYTMPPILGSAENMFSYPTSAPHKSTLAIGETLQVSCSATKSNPEPYGWNLPNDSATTVYRETRRY